MTLLQTVPPQLEEIAKLGGKWATTSCVSHSSFELEMSPGEIWKSVEICF